MRGKVLTCLQKLAAVRITPAYAGKSMLPHVAKNQQLGSPPPMRGKEEGELPCIFHCRITPAYAGKSVWYYPTRAATQDHPRLCGEKTLHDLA